MNEIKRTDVIENYAKRDASGRKALYAYQRPEAHCQAWRRSQAQALYQLLGPDLSDVRALDVGCGKGGGK